MNSRQVTTSTCNTQMKCIKDLKKKTTNKPTNNNNNNNNNNKIVSGGKLGNDLDVKSMPLSSHCEIGEISKTRSRQDTTQQSVIEYFTNLIWSKGWYLYHFPHRAQYSFRT